MALSGSKDYTPSVSDFVEEAYERCGLEIRAGWDSQSARNSINYMLADWANRGINNWTVDQVSQTLATGISEIPAGTITITVTASGAFTVAETITGGTSGATAIVLTKPTSTTMELTVPTGTFVVSETITGGTSGATTAVSAAPSLVDTQNTIDIISAVIRRSGNDITIERIGRSEYLQIPSKTTTGRPTQFFLDKQITPVIKLWQTPQNSTDILIYDRLVRMDDADAAQNDMGVPFRFFPAFAAGLAYYTSIKRAPERMTVLKALYEEELVRAMAMDSGRPSMFINAGRS
tara:strand:- start:4068 stop:4940 length:873 start_codon:yes stop_codon:yes gene_type:complete